MNLEDIKTFFGALLSFDDEYPLLFTQFYFWVFFAIVFAGFALLRNKTLLRNTYLFFVSLFFYYKTSGLFVLLLLFTTLVCFFTGRAIDKTERAVKRKIWLAVGVVVNLLVLFYFKYAYFFTEVYNSLMRTDIEVVNHLALWANSFSGKDIFDADKILLPVGISFYTFQSISYIIDVYRRKMSHITNIFNFGFYVSFFPGLVAGPIIRANQFMPQLYKKFFLTKRQFGIAIFWILNGLLKKIILSDYLAVNFVDRVFDNPDLFTAFENLSALLCYSLQVYADFSGYTDIAIGVAMLMGFYLPLNFNSPYKAVNPGEFWRRWHISLSTWLKDYLYIPLGGNRKGKLRTNVNLMTTMLLGGLWHGASWNFVIWGGLNGLGILLYKWWRNVKKLPRAITSTLVFVIFIVLQTFMPSPLFMIGVVWSGVFLVGVLIDWIYRSCLKLKPILWLDRGWAIFQTFIFISFTRLFFRSGSNLDPAEANAKAWDTAKKMVSQIGGTWDVEIIPDIVSSYSSVFILFVLGMIIHWLPVKWKQWYRLQFACLPTPVMLVVCVVAVLLVYQFVTADMQPFIYFQF